MKKILLISIAAGIYVYSFGQTATTNFNKNLATQACRQMPPASDLNVPSGPVLPQNKTVHNDRFGTEIIIGKTKYDYQSNRGMARRFHVLANGKKNASWMISVAGSPYADRGTACNLYTPGSGWSPYPQEVTPLSSMSRIETIKTGYGSWAPTNNDAGEAVIAHDGTGIKLNLETRATMGTGTWTANYLSGVSLEWPRIASGGPNNNTLHVIANVSSGTMFSGIVDAQLYTRSTNGGTTWSVPALLPGENNTLFKKMVVEDYAIAAKGNTVAIVMGGFYNSVALFKSTDNGTNWSKKMIWNSPLGAINPDTVAWTDSIVCFDAAFSVLIDNSNVVHVWGGVDRTNNPTASANSWLYFPGAYGGLIYWRDNMPTISGDLKLCNNFVWPYNSLIDLDADGKFIYHVGWNANFTIFQNVGPVSLPSGSIDGMNNLYVTFCSYADNSYHIYGTADSAIYKTIFAMRSTDNGLNWGTEATWLTPFDYPNMDYTFPSAAELVNDSLHLIYQRDDLPGNSIMPSTGNPHPTNYENDIIYLGVPTSDFVSAPAKKKADCNIKLFPNPANEYTNITYTLTKAGSINLSVINIMGQKVASYRIDGISGKNFKQVNTGNLSSGIYIVKIEAEGKIFTEKLIVK